MKFISLCVVYGLSLFLVIVVMVQTRAKAIHNISSKASTAFTKLYTITITIIFREIDVIAIVR